LTQSVFRKSKIKNRKLLLSLTPGYAFGSSIFIFLSNEKKTRAKVDYIVTGFIAVLQPAVAVAF